MTAIIHRSPLIQARAVVNNSSPSSSLPPLLSSPPSLHIPTYLAQKSAVVAVIRLVVILTAVAVRAASPRKGVLGTQLDAVTAQGERVDGEWGVLYLRNRREACHDHSGLQEHGFLISQSELKLLVIFQDSFVKEVQQQLGPTRTKKFRTPLLTLQDTLHRSTTQQTNLHNPH